MTIGANGIKIYTALDHATIWSNDLIFNYFIHDNWTWKGQFLYNIGRDNKNEGLPTGTYFYIISYDTVDDLGKTLRVKKDGFLYLVK